MSAMMQQHPVRRAAALGGSVLGGHLRRQLFQHASTQVDVLKECAANPPALLMLLPQLTRCVLCCVHADVLCVSLLRSSRRSLRCVWASMLTLWLTPLLLLRWRPCWQGLVRPHCTNCLATTGMATGEARRAGRKGCVVWDAAQYSTACCCPAVDESCSAAGVPAVPLPWPPASSRLTPLCFLLFLLYRPPPPLSSDPFHCSLLQ